MTRKVFWEDVIPFENNQYKWQKAIGKFVRFTYDNISGVMIIRNIIKDGTYTKIELEYKLKRHEITLTNFKKSMISRIIKEHGELCCGYHKDQIIKDEFRHIKLLRAKAVKGKTHDVRGFDYKCMECGHIGFKTITSINSGQGCKFTKCRQMYRGY